VITKMKRESPRSSLKLLLEISRELSSTLDLHTVLARVLFLFTRHAGAERGTLIILDETLQPVDAALVYDGALHTNTLEQLRVILEGGLAGRVLRERTPVLIQDTSLDERWLARPDDANDKTGSKSAICLPLLSRDQLAGVLTIVHPSPNTLTNEDMALLETVAGQAGAAIRNAQLYASLQEAHSRYRELFEDSIDPIVVTNWQGGIVESNRRFSLAAGLDPAQLKTRSIHNFLSSTNDQLEHSKETLKGGRLVHFETLLRPTGGVPIPVEVHIRKVEGGEDELLQWIFRDLTERKALDSLRNDLSAMVYHDLRSPLSNITSSLEMLAAVLPLEENQTLNSMLSIATRSTERLQRLINSLLDINKLEAGQTIAHQNKFSLTTLLHEALETARRSAESRQIHMELKISQPEPEVWVDDDMIRRVMINLLENAVRYSPQESAVEVGSALVDGQARVWVQDQGPGIPPEAQALIFDKFTRLNGERFPKGVGLGLAFCRLAIQAHGGRIWVESAPGNGSRFVFTLPLAADN